MATSKRDTLIVGLRTSGGTQGVGRATTNAVVASSVACSW